MEYVEPPAASSRARLVTPSRTILLLLAVLLALLWLDAAVAQTLGEAKRNHPDGSAVQISGLIVSAAFDGAVYVQSPDRSQGIRVGTPAVLASGDVVDVSGLMQTDPLTGERFIAAFPGYPQPTGSTLNIRPLMIPVVSLVGGDFGLQQGLPDGRGLNTIGLLVTTWGEASELDSSQGSFIISSPGGRILKVVAPGDVKLDQDWAAVRVTGVSTIGYHKGEKVRLLRIRSQDDIVPLESWAARRTSNMTLEQKIGQLFQIRIDGDVLADGQRQLIRDRHIGGIIYFQWNGNLNDPVRTAHLSNDLHACALGENGDGIPLLISMDQEGGRVTRITGGSHFPGNMALGAAGEAWITRLAAQTMAAEVRAVGANMDLAPVLDVNNNPDNPVIGVRSFGEQAGLVSAMGSAYVQGLHDSGIIATGKHFPGHGDTSVDSHTGLPVVTYDFSTLDTVHGKPFRDAIAAGLDAIMTAHIVVTSLDPGRPATLSPAVIDGYLRGDLGFDGVVMTDSMGMAGITAGYGVGEAAVLAIKAGVDLLSLPPNLDAAMDAVQAAVLAGEISRERLDESVARILRLKRRAGLFDHPFVDAAAAATIVGSPEHQQAELTAARSAITLVQNTDGLLPLTLAAEQKILLVTVQSSETTADASARLESFIASKHSNVQPIAITENPGTGARESVLEAAESADIIIFGTSRAHLFRGQRILVNNLVETGKPVIALGMREPYELASFPGVTSYLSLYTYRSCGLQAAAEVLFGEVSPTGRLPVAIPGLYPFGHGLEP